MASAAFDFDTTCTADATPAMATITSLSASVIWYAVVVSATLTAATFQMPVAKSSAKAGQAMQL